MLSEVLSEGVTVQGGKGAVLSEGVKMLREGAVLSGGVKLLRGVWC